MKAIQHHPHNSHSSRQHLQRASVVVTPREAGRGFSGGERRQLEVRKAEARWLKLEWRSHWKTVRLESQRRLKMTARIDGGMADGSICQCLWMVKKMFGKLFSRVWLKKMKIIKNKVVLFIRCGLFFQVNFNITCWVHLIYLYILKEKSWMSKSVILGFVNLLHCWFFTLLVQPFYCCCDFKRVCLPTLNFPIELLDDKESYMVWSKGLSFSPHLTLWPTWCVWTRPDRLCVILHQLLLLSVCPFLSQVSLTFFSFFLFLGQLQTLGLQ